MAQAFLLGGPTVESLAARASETLGRDWKWMRALAGRYASRFAESTRPRLRGVIAFLDADPRFQLHLGRSLQDISALHQVLGEATMRPVAAAATWTLPSIATAGDLAAWLALNQTELEWLADLRGLQMEPGRTRELRHYHYRLEPKRKGGFRLIEEPKPRIKALQRKLLLEILNRIPPHEAAHGFVRGRDIRSFVAPHVGREAVLRMDLKDFFPSVRRTRVQALFRTLGYPESVADLLGGLTTTRTPREIFLEVPAEYATGMQALYARTHLPQGAPTSPALVNACCYRLDCRLAGLARAAGASYTRYADDLAFSGGLDFLRGTRRFAAHVAATVSEEGFAVNFRKTRMMRRGVRQQLAGLVVNQRVNVRRDDYDALKAILTNCIRHGAEVENRAGRSDFHEHLAGKVAFVALINPQRGLRLQQMLQAIAW